MYVPPPQPDPQLEAKYGRRKPRPAGGKLLIGIGLVAEALLILWLVLAVL